MSGKTAPPGKTADEISPAEIDALMKNAISVVESNFDENHLPQVIREFVRPISTATCQGMYATTMMLCGAMPSLTNGCAVRLWTQKSSPLALLVFHIAPPQRGKSRLFQTCEVLMEVCDDVVEQMAREHAQTLRAEGADEVPVQVKSMSIQSCTATEMFFRCSCDFPQVQARSHAAHCVLMPLCLFHVRSVSHICMRLYVHIRDCSAAVNVLPDHTQCFSGGRSKARGAEQQIVVGASNKLRRGLRVLGAFWVDRRQNIRSEFQCFHAEHPHQPGSDKTRHPHLHQLRGRCASKGNLPERVGKWTPETSHSNGARADWQSHRCMQGEILAGHRPFCGAP